MPFDLSLAIKLGKFVNDAYGLSGTPLPSSITLSDPTYTCLLYTSRCV